MVGIGGAAESTDMVLNIGPQHPSTHGVLRLRLVLDGERIQHAEPVIGYMHRGAEKLFEARDYRQIIMLANRHDWLSAFSNELGVVLAVERMLGMEVPERAVWTRTLLAELNRVLNHLMFLGSYPLELGGITPIFYAFREREELQNVMEEISGGRMHYMFNRVGGLKEDMPGRLDRTRACRRRVRALPHGPLRRPGARQRDLPRAYAGRGHALPGGRARLRSERSDRPRLRSRLRPAPRRAVPRVRGAPGHPEGRHPPGGRLPGPLRVPPGADPRRPRPRRRLPGPARRAAPGPINQRLPKVLKAPEGHTYAWTENPLGINGYYLVSKGEKTPYRLKLRSASYNNIQALAELLPGTLVADMVAILGSLFFVVGDIDK
jgi:NADH-quinone oxidoreductase subunit D